MTQDQGPVAGREEYDPKAYWDERLKKNFTLRGVGHHVYHERYNEWIYRAKARALRSVLPAPAGRALDVGSGVGWVVERLREAGWDVEGCDISPHAVSELRAKFPGVEFFQVQLGVDALPREAASYDLVTILDVTYHIVDDAIWSQGIRDLGALLRPGGHLIVLDRFGAEDDDAAAHVRFRSRSTWAPVLESAGLAPEATRPAYRWLSRGANEGVLRHAPQRLRGPIEFALERLVPREPHLRIARFVKR
jgi:SAM-dependent methyltransferase